MTSFPRRRDFNTLPGPEQRLQPIDFLYRGLERAPSAIAVETPETRLTYAELVTEVEALAAAFQAIDPKPGTRVGTCAWNTRSHLTAVLAAYAAGKVWVPLNPRNGRAELDAMIGAARPTLIVADESCVGKFSDGYFRLVSGEGITDLIALHRGQVPDRGQRRPSSIQVIKFSGGSTGAPKGVLQSLKCINAQASAIQQVFGFTSRDVNLVAAPITHGTSCFLLPVFAAGGRHVLLEKAAPSAILGAFASCHVTTVYLPPTLIYMLLADPALRPEGYPSLRHLIYSAAPMPVERIRQVREAFGPVLETAYGQVEAPQIVTAMRAEEFDDPRNLESVGRATASTWVAVMDQDRRILPSGQLGEIVVRGDLVMNGYLDQPELTAQTIVEGWLHTGDLGLLDERGYLYLKGRVRELIISGGFNIFPADVEAVLCRHPAVYECSVFGVEDPKWGEAVHAAVHLREGATATESELIAFVKGELDSVKAPKRIHLVAGLPRNAVGKISRRDVRAQILDRVGTL